MYLEIYMNLGNFISFIGNINLFLKEKNLPSLSDRNKKIVFIATIIALGALATYVVKRCFFSAALLNDQVKNIKSVSPIDEGENLPQEKRIKINEPQNGLQENIEKVKQDPLTDKGIESLTDSSSIESTIEEGEKLPQEKMIKINEPQNGLQEDIEKVKEKFPLKELKTRNLDDLIQWAKLNDNGAAVKQLNLKDFYGFTNKDLKKLVEHFPNLNCLSISSG